MVPIKKIEDAILKTLSLDDKIPRDMISVVVGNTIVAYSST
jgi:hypothetical protein